MDSGDVCGRLEVLKFLRRRPRGGGDVAPGGDVCSWDESTCTAAARNGRLAVLVWARDYGCPWGANTWRAARDNGHVHVLEWAAAHGLEAAEGGGISHEDEEDESLVRALSWRALAYEQLPLHVKDGAPSAPLTTVDDAVEPEELYDSDEEEAWSTVSSYQSWEYGDIDDAWHLKYDDAS